MTFKSIKNCCIVIIVNMTVRCVNASSLRILGERDARAGEFPYMVSIEQVITPGDSTKNVLQCTGSVLTSTTTLTAAHCCEYEELIRQGKIDSAVIRYGTANGKTTTDDRFSEILSCEKRSYDHPAVWDDLALLRTRPIPLPSYARISGLDHRLLFGQRVLILGYGFTNSSDNEMAPALHLEKPLQVTDAMWSKCQRHRSLVQKYPSVCALMPCGRHSGLCPGDSGGPVLHASGMIGVSARSMVSENCHMRSNSHPLAVVAMPLSPHIDWIASIVKEIPKF